MLDTPLPQVSKEQKDKEQGRDPLPGWLLVFQIQLALSILCGSGFFSAGRLSSCP